MAVPDSLGIVQSTVGEIRFDACVDENGFGTVYRGTHLGRNEPVAIKCLRLSRLASLTERMRASIVARFTEEMTILQSLSQGTLDIVRCYASGQLFAPATGERVPYVVLEWLDGRPLKADLAERRERGMGGRSLQETLDLVESAALALAYAHSRGIVHRDIKPSNLMLTRTRGGLRLKVLDFGLAKILTGGPGASTNIATADGVHLVSVAYCAPEQLSSSVGEVGPWTDVYSLSLVMLELLRGERIPHPTTGTIRPSNFGITLSPAVEDLLTRALSQNPMDRPANAGVFWSSLRELNRQSSPPVADAAALAATAFDGPAVAALQRVRASLPISPNPPPANQHTGTLVMAAPPNVPYPPHHAPQIAMKSDPPGTTEPLASRINIPSSVPGSASAGPYGSTVGLAPPRSPLATSMTSSIPSPPIAPPPSSHVPSQPGPIAPTRVSEPPNELPARRGSGLVIALLVLVLAGGGGVAYFFLR